MTHLRKLARDDNMNSCAAKPKAIEFMQMKKLLKSVVLPVHALERVCDLPTSFASLRKDSP